MRARRGLCRAIGLALAGLILVQCSSRSPDIDPVDFERGDQRIQLSFLGRYTMGLYDIGGAVPAVYDPQTRRLFVVGVDFGWIDSVGIGDPAEPKLVRRQVVLGYGFPQSIAFSRGILAVAFSSVIKALPGKVVFFDTDGKQIGNIVPVGIKPVQLRFTPDGQTLLVANQGEANDSYTIDPQGSISVIDLGIEDPDCRGAACQIKATAVQLDFEAFNDQRDALIAEGVRIYGPNASVAQDLEPEAVAIAPDGQKAWVALQRNNAMAVVDIPAREIVDIFALGTKDHSVAGSGLDASDEDDATNIQPWPIRSFYSPDIFAAYDVNGQTFLVTPNEGDPRDFDDYTENVRVSEIRLDPDAFPDAANLQRSRNLGRLRVTNADGDADGDGRFEELFVLGSRSFAIWTAEGALVFDSGDDLERIMAEAVPSCFNCGGGDIRPDAWSPARGPEPEALTIGQVSGRDYVFVAPERIGGIYVYDITDPAAPAFQQYINFRDFTIDPAAVCEEKRPMSDECAAAGDLEAEGVLFIAGADSPVDVPLVVVTNELSTSATIYRIDEVR